jgi:hypothetical protein
MSEKKGGVYQMRTGKHWESNEALKKHLAAKELPAEKPKDKKRAKAIAPDPIVKEEEHG